jgi:periplasmic protein TonB
MNGHVASPRSQQPASSRAPAWVTPVSKDPLERVFELGGDKAVRVMAIATLITLFFHGVAAARTAYIHAEVIRWTQHVDALIDHKLATQRIEIETLDTPKREEPPPEEKPVEPTPVVTMKENLPVAAAKAAQVLSAPDDAPLDLTGNVFNVGNSERYAGGQTMSNGTNDKPPVATKVAETGTKEQTAPAIVAVDLSRTATLAGSGEWRCPFPPEADADQVDDASAIIEVIVSADGKARSATILQDPGHGFGREARSCAMRESYVPALDKAGAAVSSSKKFRVKFER